MQITSIKPKPKRPGAGADAGPAAFADPLLVVRAGRETLGTLHKRDVAAMGLTEGMAVDAALLERIREADEYQRLRTMAARWIGKAPLSRAVLEKKAADKGFLHPLIQRLLGEFAKLGLIDDAALAQRAASAEISRKPAGEAFIREKLVRRGIDEGLAEDVASNVAGQRDAFADALTLVRAKFGRGMSSTRGMDAVTQRRRAFGLLARRGFDEDVIERALDEALGRVDEVSE